jgi:MFS family permease
MLSAERAYQVMVGEEDTEERACLDIPEEACHSVPGSFLLNLLNGASTKLAEQLASPGLVLPWLFGALGVPAALSGWLMPLRRAGSMAPQLALSGLIRSRPKRKHFWTLAGLIQAVCLGAMIPAAALLEPMAAGVVILLLLAVFSVASGMGSVAFSDVVGKTIPKRRRGRLLGWRGAVGGVLTVAAGLVLRLLVKGQDDLTIYLILIAVAAVLWAIAAILFALIDEQPGATEGGISPIHELDSAFKILRTRTGFRRYLYARILLLVSVELSLPWFALHSRSLIGGDLGGLGLFVVVSGLAASLSSTIWGGWSDRSSRKAMVAAGIVGLVTVAAALGNGALPSAWVSAWTYTPVFFLSGVARAGARMGRKTYIVDAVSSEQRATYVATSNTIVGIAGLLSGVIGFVLAWWGATVLLALIGGLSIAAAILAMLMPEAEEMLDK